ncbi:uncharacterized protein LOC128965317 isoform X2 [Oppia nitens]|nr:uncharacterized protein LOC128965317 isoform X2 [Oppia nitens]
MSVTTSNFHFSSTGWCNRETPVMMMSGTTNEPANTGISPNVDDGLTSLSWLQNLNMCMTRLGAPTPPTPPASPICSSIVSLPYNHYKQSNCNSKINVSTVDNIHNTSVQKAHSYHNHKDGKSQSHSNSNSSKKSSQAQETDPIDYKTNGSVKPPYSYATLICMAMKANKNKMTLSAIYKWIRENFMYYKNADPSWQNSIRHNLSLNKCFIKIPRNKDEPGKGGFWRLDPVYADTLVDGVFKKRRPSHRGSNGGNTNGTSIKKKSRKKDALRNDCSQNTNMTDMKSITATGAETPLLHDTPPNSTESYTLYGEAANDVVELVTAVSSIEAVPVGQCDSYSYSMHSSQSDTHLSHPGYGNEVCVTETASDACMLETDGNDICWNAILTDADLNELSNYTNPVIHATDSTITVSDSTTTTAQLTAVEPHTLHLVTNTSPVTTVLEETEMFQNAVPRHINCLALRQHMGSDVISATQNVVTCVNPTTVSTTDWNQWQAFSTVANTDSTDLLIRQINGNCEPIVSPSPPIAYITTTSVPIATRVSIKQSNCVNNSTMNANSATSTQPSSPTSGNFEHTNPLQPWAECKAALEAAALDLESFGTLDVHNY